MGGKRRGGPWYGEDRRRLRFDRGARRVSAWQSSPAGRGGGWRYRFTLPVPGYGTRRVEVLFRPDRPSVPLVSVDGPGDSPHRYHDGTLCLYHPHDPIERRWVLDDGLLELIGLIAAHLFREAWWREHGEWLGPQVTHTPTNSKKPDTSEERAA